jgi:hypothetical protein
VVVAEGHIIRESNRVGQVCCWPWALDLGASAATRITGTSPHIGVVVLTMLEDDDSVFAALRASARGYVLKGALRERLIRAVRAAADGEAVFGPAIARRIADYFARAARPAAAFPTRTPSRTVHVHLNAFIFSTPHRADLEQGPGSRPWLSICAPHAPFTVGGRIMAQALVGLLQRYPHPYPNAARKPAPPIATTTGQFTFVDLLRYAGAA